MDFIPLEKVKRNIMNELPEDWEECMEDLYGPLETKVEELLERNHHLTMMINSLKDNIISKYGLSEGQALIQKAIGEA